MPYFPSDASDTAYTTPDPKGVYLTHLLAVQNKHKLLDVVRKHPWLLTKPHPDDGRFITHTITSLGYRGLLRKLLHNFPQAIDLLTNGRNEHIVHLAVVFPNILRDVLQHDKIPVNLINYKGLTPLALSIVHGVFPSYKHLLEVADPNLSEPLSEACLIVRHQTYDDIRKWFTTGTEYGMNVNRIAQSGVHAIAYSVMLRRIDVFKMLVDEYNADINAKGPQYNHVLFHIITRFKKPLRLLKWSASRGMTFDVTNAAWKSPVDVYKEKWGGDAQPETIAFLLRQQKRNPIKPTDYIFPNASDVHPSIAHHAAYSANMNHIALFVFSALKRHKAQLHVPLTTQAPFFYYSKLDSEDVMRIKVRLQSVQEFSRAMSCFIEYRSPDIFFMPHIPAPADDRLTVFILSLLGDNTNHSNLLIIDPRLKLIERFDPEGTPNDKLDAWLRHHLSPFLNEYSFISPGTTPYAYQLVETARGSDQPGDPIGFCSAWCMWYMEFRATNRDIHPSRIWDSVKDRLITTGIREHIRNYSLALSDGRNRMLERVLGSHSKNKETFTPHECRKIQAFIDSKLAHKTAQQR